MFSDSTIVCLLVCLSGISAMCLSNCLSCLSVWRVACQLYCLPAFTICLSSCLSSCCFSPQLMCLRYLIFRVILFSFCLWYFSPLYIVHSITSDTKDKSTGIQGRTLTHVMHQIYLSIEHYIHTSVPNKILSICTSLFLLSHRFARVVQ